MSDTAAATFSVAQLWLLQSRIRHEMQGQETWKYPPASVELNDQIAEALLACHRHNLSEAALVLSWGDCLLIDFVTPGDAKDANGKPIGREILLASYEARDAIRRGAPAATDYAEPCTGAEARAWLSARPGKDADNG